MDVEQGGRDRCGIDGAQCDGVFGATPVARNIYDISQQRVLMYVRCVRRSTLCYVFVYAVHDFSPKCCVLAVVMFIAVVRLCV